MKLNSKNSDLKVEITIANSTILRITAFVVAIVLGYWILIHAKHAIGLIFIAFFLALALNSPVAFFSRILPGRLKDRRWIGTLIAVLVFLVLVGAFFTYIVPPLANQTKHFVHTVPGLVNDIQDKKGAIGHFIRHNNLENAESAISKQVNAYSKHIGGPAFKTLTAIAHSLISIVTIVVLTIMMLIEGDKWMNLFFRLVPDKHRKMTRKVAVDMYGVIRGFVNGQVTLSFISLIFLTPAILILKLPYPAALLIVVFISGLIPMIGHTIGAIILGIVGAFHSISSGIIILIYYIIYQQFENYFVQPKVQSSYTKISPLLVFISLVVGLSFGGIIGGLMAVPIGGCLKVVVLEIIDRNGLLENNKPAVES